MTLRRRQLLPAVLVLAACATTKRDVPAPPLWNGLTPGQHAVGTRTEVLTSAPHRLPVTVWYPATRGGTQLSYRDGVEAGGEEVAEYAKLMIDNGVPADSVDRLFAQPYLARAGAEPQRGSFPLVLVAQGRGHWSLHQSIIAEFLASHGYVVAAIPSIVRLGVAMTSEADLPRVVAAEADDLERAQAFAATLPNVDEARLVTLGHSLGARAALLHATRHNVAAVISLDGGIGTSRGVSSFPRPSGDLPPILHVYEERDRERLATDLTFLRSLPTRELRVIKLDNVGHIHFSILGFAAALDPAIAKATGGGEGVREDMVKMANEVLAFAQKYAK